MSNLRTYNESYEILEHEKFSRSGGQGDTFIVRRKRPRSDSFPYLIKILKQQKDLERRARMRREFISLQTLKIDGIPSVIESNTEYYENLEYNPIENYKF